MSMPRRKWIGLLTGSAAAMALGGWTVFSAGERVAPRPPAPAPITEAAKEAAVMVDEFNFDLYRAIAAERDGNLFLSPYSVSGCLLMAAEGARGTTAEEIGHILHFPETARVAGNAERPWNTKPQLTAFGDLNRSLRPIDGPEVAAGRKRLKTLEGQLATLQKKIQVEIRGGKFDRHADEQRLVDEINTLRTQLDPYELRVANALWVDSQFPLRKDFLDVVTGDYGATARTVDFRNRPDAERIVMNDWASEQTNGRIQDVLAPGSITELTRLVLMNAVYFKGEWTDPFDAAQTKEQPFIVADGSESKCMLMWDWRGARFAEYRPDGESNGLVKAPPPDGSPYKFEWKWADNPDGWKLLELPYKGDRLSFVAILPGKPDGVAEVERRLNQETVAKWLEGMSGQEVQISLPRFKMKQQFELGGPLAAMGMPSAFSPGGLTGVSDDSDAQLLMISQVIHSTFVELNEKGTEAAAVTAMPAPASAAPDLEPPKPPAIFRADHPFVFLIRDTKTGAILFMGRMATP
jgi:serine protease inhibitor